MTVPKEMIMEIKVHKNNSVLVKLSLLMPDGSAFNVSTGNILVFTVKKDVTRPDDEILVQKSLIANGGSEYFIQLTGFDTNLSVGNYSFDFKDTTANYTLINPSPFIIKEVDLIGEPITGLDNELIELDANVDLVSNDYLLIQNKPQINGIELVGNKTSSDLGLGETWVLINTADFSDTETNSVEFLQDSDGNAFSLKRFRLVFNLNHGSTQSNGSVAVNDMPDNRYISQSVYVSYRYNNTNFPCYFETIESDGRSVVSLNTYPSGATWKSPAAASLPYDTEPPFTSIKAVWSTATTGIIELWGIK